MFMLPVILGIFAGLCLTTILPRINRRIAPDHTTPSPLHIFCCASMLCALAFALILHQHSGAYAWLLIIVTMWLILAAWIDFLHYLLLDIFTLPLLIAGLLAAWCNLLPLTFTESCLGALIGYFMLWIPALCFKKCRGYDGLGGGDIKLLAAIGAWTSPLNMPAILSLACMLGLIYMLFRHSTQKIPFGPCISVAGWLALLWNPIIIPLWLTTY